MADRKHFEMTEADLAKLLEACRPVPAIMLHISRTPSAQEKANAVWAELGKRMGFDPITARPSGRGDRFFTAVPVDRPVAHEAWPKSHVVQ